MFMKLFVCYAVPKNQNKMCIQYNSPKVCHFVGMLLANFASFFVGGGGGGLNGLAL
jgi:hypothetical protein